MAVQVTCSAAEGAHAKTLRCIPIWLIIKGDILVCPLCTTCLVLSLPVLLH
jgi:hypothetical protein